MNHSLSLLELSEWKEPQDGQGEVRQEHVLHLALQGKDPVCFHPHPYGSIHEVTLRCPPSLIDIIQF